jgi:hypothetical protein
LKDKKEAMVKSAKGKLENEDKGGAIVTQLLNLPS